MSVKSTRSILIQGELETTRGTDPAGTKVPVLVNPGSIAVVSETSTPRDVVTDSFTKLSPSISGSLWNLPCTVELAGGGVGTPPPMDWMLQSSGLLRSDAAVIAISAPSGTFEVGEDVVNTTQTSQAVGKVGAASATELIIYELQNMPATSDVLTGSSSSATGTTGTTAAGYAYRPTSERDEIKTSAIYAYMGGAGAIKKVMLGTLSTCVFNIGVGPKPNAEFNFQGIYQAPTDEAAPTANYSTVVAPDSHNGTSVFGAVDLSDIAKESIVIDLGNEIVQRLDLDAADAIKGLELTNRTVTSTWDPEISNISDFDPYAIKKAQTKTHFQYRWGSDAGNRHIVDHPASVISAIAEVDRNGIGAYNITFNPEGINGVKNSEFLYVIY